MNGSNRARFLDPTRFRLALALPHTFTSREHDLVGGEPRDFMRGESDRARRAAAERAAGLIDLAQLVCGPSTARPLRRIAEFPAFFAEDPDVVTVVGHSPSPSEIELLDERTTFACMAEAIPRQFAGMIELRICDGEAHGADLIRRARPGCIVRAPYGPLAFGTVVWSYARALRLVVGNRIPYDEAARAVRAELVSLAQRKKVRE